MVKGGDDANFCCCLTRIFLVIIGLVGAAFFGLLAGLHFVEVEMVKTSVKMSYDSDAAWWVSVSVCAVMSLIYLFLVVGAMLQLKTLICIFIVVNTLFTLVFITMIGLLLAAMTGKLGDKEKEKLDSLCDENFEDAADRAKCKDEKERKSWALWVGIIFLAPTIAIYAVVTAASCSYVQQLKDD